MFVLPLACFSLKLQVKKEMTLHVVLWLLWVNYVLTVCAIIQILMDVNSAVLPSANCPRVVRFAFS